MEALLYESLENREVRCNLCSHRCRIKDGHTGICGVRENRGGVLETLVYGNLIARSIDPVEKKPLFHLCPGSLSFSIATMGCNFRCRFCQNADIAQLESGRNPIRGVNFTPEKIVEDALRGRCKSIAYTYTEPTVYFEFALETAKRASAKGIRNVFVTNGYMTAEALDMISPYLDAANVDLKAFSDDFYKKYCGSRIKYVKETLVRMKRLGVFVEVTTLVIPGLNDDPDELKALAAFIADELGPDTPWHVSRFHPCYRLTDRPSTPSATLVAAREKGFEAGLKYVYTGNIPGDIGENTFCPECREILIRRWGFNVEENRVRNGACPFCGTHINGVEL